jgi:hypothetical protein
MHGNSGGLGSLKDALPRQVGVAAPEVPVARRWAGLIALVTSKSPESQAWHGFPGGVVDSTTRTF